VSVEGAFDLAFKSFSFCPKYFSCGKGLLMKFDLGVIRGRGILRTTIDKI